MLTLSIKTPEGHWIIAVVSNVVVTSDMKVGYDVYPSGTRKQLDPGCTFTIFDPSGEALIQGVSE